MASNLDSGHIHIALSCDHPEHLVPLLGTGRAKCDMSKGKSYHDEALRPAPEAYQE